MEARIRSSKRKVTCEKDDGGCILVQENQMGRCSKSLARKEKKGNFSSRNERKGLAEEINAEKMDGAWQLSS